jgi:hypothetical protein
VTDAKALLVLRETAKKAKNASWRLDARIALALGLPQAYFNGFKTDTDGYPFAGFADVDGPSCFGAAHWGGGGRGWHAPPFTASLDAALTIVPKGWILSDMHDEDCGVPGSAKADGAYCALTNGTWEDAAEGSSDARSRVARSLAVVVAALSARIIDAEGDASLGDSHLTE